MKQQAPTIERVFIEADGYNGRAEMATELLVAQLGEVAIETTDDIAEANALVVIGGDGTFHKTLHKYDLPDIPVTGINIGTVGFLMDTEARLDDVANRAQQLADGNFRIQSIPTVQMEEESTGYRVNAVNEVVIERASAQALNAHYRIGKAAFKSFTGDGLIIANAFGSTGYGASAGGDYLDPDVVGYQVVHVNEYLSSRRDSLQRPVILGPNTHTVVEMDNTDKRPYRLARDGKDLKDWACDGSPLTIGLSPDKMVNMIRFDDYDWATRLHDVLHHPCPR
jgi:NAD+ kinase